MRERDTLDKIEATTKIVASIVVPILIAYFGWAFQEQQSKADNKKEYVKMALEVLSDKSEQVDPELKSWAVQILNNQSPVPFAAELSEGIKSGRVDLTRYIYKPPSVLLTPPSPLPSYNGRTNGDLLEHLITLARVCEFNSDKHTHLLEWIEDDSETSAEPQNNSVQATADLSPD